MSMSQIRNKRKWKKMNYFQEILENTTHVLLNPSNQILFLARNFLLASLKNMSSGFKNTFLFTVRGEGQCVNYVIKENGKR